MSDVDVCVVGAGLAGAAAARELTGRGHGVLLLEQYAVGHRLGSSHGSSRIYRRAYADPFYVRLTGRADAEWRRLEEESGVALRTRTGGLDTGSGRQPAALRDLLTAHGVAAELLSAESAAERWPGMLFDGPVTYHPDAGHLDADATVATLVDLAVAGGARLHEHERLVELAPRWEGGVSVATERSTYTAGKVVVAAGAWLPELGLPAVPRLRVKQQEAFHFRHRDPAAAWPTLVHKAHVQLYGLPSGSDVPIGAAMKVAQFDSESTTTASTRDGVVDDRARRVVVDHVERWLPGLDPVPVLEQSCLFTMTPDEDFLLDRRGDVVVASPCSGHGAKFAPLTGVLVADLVEGAEPDPRFALRRPQVRAREAR